MNCCPGVNFETQESLIDDGILESLDIVTIVGDLMDKYDIVIGVDDLAPENFNSARAIFSLIQKLREEQ